MASLNQHRVYIPSSARANQYVLVEFKPNDEFFAQFTNISCGTSVLQGNYLRCAMSMNFITYISLRMINYLSYATMMRRTV